jgi:hypothetical protein
MKPKPAIVAVMTVLAVVVPCAKVALGVEGGLGRPISGMSIAPFAGVIPPEPGFACYW